MPATIFFLPQADLED